MAILISSTVKNQTPEGYNSVLHAVKDSIMAADGFIMHCAHPDEGEWKVFELWKSKEQADKWFAKAIVPNLPPGIHPKRSYRELHSFLTPTESFLSE